MKSPLVLLFTFLISFSVSLAQNAIAPLFPVTITHDFAEPEMTFDEVRKLILSNYYSAEVTDQALYWAAIEGMLRHISPPENPDLAKIWQMLPTRVVRFAGPRVV